MAFLGDDDDDETLLELLAAERTATESLLNARRPHDEAGSATSLPALEQRERRHSVWECDSMTPMTTRPHLPPRSHCDTNNNSPRHRRVRSRSLGTERDGGTLSSSFFHSLRAPPLQVLTASEGNTVLFSGKNRSPMNGKLQLTAGALIVQERPPPSLSRISRKDAAFEHVGNPVWVCVLYGMINASIVLPVLMSFGSIIYRDEAFAPYMPVLVKLTIVSGVVHQLCFSTFSSLPFAVGQVQDAGLIFLSSMASKIVQYCNAQGYDDATMLATVTVGLSLATALLGCGLVLVGYLRLAEYVQLLPTCVVGGYLAFIGWFCGMAGISLMTGASNVTPLVIVGKFVYVLPGVIGGVLVYLAVSKIRHMAALPVSILLEIVLFYFVLWATGSSVEEATTNGWIRDTDPPPAWHRTWDYLRFDKVDWAALPSLILTEWMAMSFVCALSSSLDVAAIELELNRPLDYNHELKMIGLSNLLSGATGGYTGSYIFSQSIFSLRAGIRSRLAGYALAMCEVAFLVLPVHILAYIPNFFFGSLLSMICIDLMYEWLWNVRGKLTGTEYFLCLATFGLIQVTNLEYGILAGVGLYLTCKKIGLDVGVSKFATTPSDEEGDPLIAVEEVGEDSRHVTYGSMPDEAANTF